MLLRVQVVAVPFPSRRRLLGRAPSDGVAKLPRPRLEIGSHASAVSVRPHSQSMSSSVRFGISFRSKSGQWDVLYSERKRDHTVAMSLILDPDRSPSPFHAAVPSVALASAIMREVELSVSADR